MIVRVRRVRALGEPIAVFAFICECEDCIVNAGGRDDKWVPRTARPRADDLVGDEAVIEGRFRKW